MIVRRSPLFVAAVAMLAVSGCYTATLDPELTGLFACDPVEDEDEANPCPSGQACVNERCEDADLVPRVNLVDPEDEEPVQVNGVFPPVRPPPMNAPAIDVVVTLQASLELVAAASEDEHVFGQGYATLTVDGEQTIVLDAGSLASPAALTVQVPPLAGAHRLVMQAFRNDGVAYDNPEATATRLFWLENEFEFGARPFVAVKSPWPGTAFDTSADEIRIEVVGRNVTLVEPGGVPPGAEELKFGHAHVFYDKRFPECGQQSECENLYLSVTDVGGVVEAFPLPSAVEPTGTITALLRRDDHTAFGFPLGCNPIMGTLDVCEPVFETIEILRVDD